MPQPLVDVDLDALAPLPKRVQLGGKIFKLPGDMPMPLFLRLQNYEQRVETGENEATLLSELQAELLSLFQVHQPALKALPEIGVLVLLQSIGAIYGGAASAEGEAPPNRETRRAKKRTPSKPAAKAKASKATSR